MCSSDLIFVEFSFTRRVETKRNDNFYFLSFSSFANVFWLGMKPLRYFLIFLLFLLFFWNFLLLVGLEYNGTIIFIFSLSQPFPTYCGRNKAIMVFFNLLKFSSIFLEFCITHGVETKRNDNFHFLSFSLSSTLFWLQKKP